MRKNEAKHVVRPCRHSNEPYLVEEDNGGAMGTACGARACVKNSCRSLLAC